MKRFLLAIALACAVSGIASAGEVPSTGVPSPAPGDSSTAGALAPATQSSSVMASVILAILSAIR